MHFSFISTYMLYIGSHTLFTLFRCINTNTHAHTHAHAHAHAHAHCSLSNCWAVWAVMLSLVIRVATPKPSILGERAGPAQFITKPQQTTIQTITLIVLTQYPYGMYTIQYNTRIPKDSTPSSSHHSTLSLSNLLVLPQSMQWRLSSQHAFHDHHNALWWSWIAFLNAGLLKICRKKVFFKK